MSRLIDADSVLYDFSKMKFYDEKGELAQAVFTGLVKASPTVEAIPIDRLAEIMAEKYNPCREEETRKWLVKKQKCTTSTITQNC